MAGLSKEWYSVTWTEKISSSKMNEQYESAFCREYGMNRQILIIVMLIMSAAPMSCKKSHVPLAEEYTLSSKDSFPE